MRIKKNGKVITLSENDIKRIVKMSLNERTLDYDPSGGIGSARSTMRRGINSILQGEHDLLKKILANEIDIDVVFEKLQECFEDMPETCNAMNIVQNKECGLMEHLKCIKELM